MRKASLRSTLDLQKKRTIFKDICPGDVDLPIAIEYDKGHLNDYRLGTAHVRGYMLLSLPLGHYPKRPKSVIPELDEFMRDWAVESGLLEMGTSFYTNFMNSPSAPPLYLAPMLKEDSKEFRTFLKFVTLNFCMDDQIDDAISSSNNKICVNSLQQLKQAIEDILMGKYSSREEIEKLALPVPFFNCVCSGLLEIYQELVEIVPGYLKVNAYFGLMGKNWQCDQCYMTVRLESGQRALFEIIAILSKVLLEDEIRRSLPFKIFYDAGDYISSLANDIFSLEQELDDGEFSCNMILRKCVLKKMPLQMSIDLCRDMINDAVIDMDQSGKDLVQLSPENEDVKRFIRYYQCFVDGNLYLFVENKKRYGICKYSIKKVLYEDCLF